jgi:hypothetical protein
VPALVNPSVYVEWTLPVRQLTINPGVILHTQKMIKIKRQELICVSPGIEPGYIVFSSHKNNVQFIAGRTAIV